MLEKILLSRNINIFNIEHLSDGWSNTIFHGRSKNSEIKNIIIKVMKSEITEYNFENIYLHLLQAIKNEITALSILNHEKIPRIINYFTHENIPYLILEKKNGVTLFEFINNNKVNWRLIKDFTTQIIDIISYVHEHGIIHFDINPHNIIVSHANSDTPSINLIDFGASQFLDNPPTWNYPLGRHRYMPPEILKGRHDKPPYQEIGFGVDIHQLGCLIYFMSTREDPFRRPFEHEDYTTEYLDSICDFMRSDIEEKIEYFYVESIMPKNFIETYKKMLHPNPKLRYKKFDHLRSDFIKL